MERSPNISWVFHFRVLCEYIMTGFAAAWFLYNQYISYFLFIYETSLPSHFFGHANFLSCTCILNFKVFDIGLPYLESLCCGIASFHERVTTVLFFSGTALMVLLGVLDFLFVNHACHSIITRGASVQLVFGFEVNINLILVLLCLSLSEILLN